MCVQFTNQCRIPHHLLFRGAASSVLHGRVCRVLVTSYRLFAERNRSRNYYDVLGISKKATDKEIKSAYYKLSKLYHPDKNIGDEEAIDRFREVTEAYETLGNEDLKSEYDKNNIPLPILPEKAATRPIHQMGVAQERTVPRVEWQSEDYTAFYRQRRQEGFYKAQPQAQRTIPQPPTDANRQGAYYTQKEAEAYKNYIEKYFGKEGREKGVNPFLIVVIVLCGVMLGSILQSIYEIDEKSGRKD